MKNHFPKMNAERIDEQTALALDELAELAAIVCQTPLAFVNLNVNRARLRINFQEFCFQLHPKLTHYRIFAVEDAFADRRFAKNRFVKGAPHIRFYAGIPLIDAAGKMFGSLSVIDYRPRRLDSAQADTLKIIARQIVSQYELRRRAAQNEHLLQLNDKIIEGLQSELDMREIAEIMKREAADDKIFSRFSFSANWSEKPTFAELNSNGKREKTSRAVTQLLSAKRILIADPNLRARRLLKQYSVVWGLEAVETATGEETLKTLRRAFENGKPFDLAVIDTSLPDREGFALARQIKADADLCKTEIILMTAHGQRGDALLAAEIGVAGYLTKPLQGAQVFDCLVSALAGFENGFQKNEGFSPTVLDANDGGDKEFAKETFNLYLNETEKNLDEIKNALENENAPAIEEITNAVCGNSRAVGAEKIALIAKRINENARRRELKKINPLLENFIEEFSRLQTELVEIGDGLFSFNQRI